MPNFLTKLFSGGAKEIISSVGSALDGLITSKEELAAAKLEIEKEVNRHIEALSGSANKELELVLSDRQNAREMFKANSHLQKIYAIVFLSAYVGLTAGMCFMVYKIAVDNIHIADWAIGFTSSIWGAMSTKVSTITDFLFGSSYTMGDSKNSKGG